MPRKTPGPPPIPPAEVGETLYLAPKDIAVILDCSTSTAYELAHTLPHFILGKRGLRVRKDVFYQHLADQEGISREPTYPQLKITQPNSRGR